MRRHLPSVLAFAAFALHAVAPSAHANDLIVGPDGYLGYKPVKTLVDLRFTNVVRQAYDVSCGAAALATLLKYYYGVQVDEKAIIDGILSKATPENQKKIAIKGFSMLELKNAAERFGFQGAGFQIDNIEKLASLKIPVLTLITVRRYKHFVVLKGVEGGKVYIADPAFGNRSRSIDWFADEWDGVILALVNDRLPRNEEFIIDHIPRPRAQDLITVLNQQLQTRMKLPGEF